VWKLYLKYDTISLVIKKERFCFEKEIFSVFSLLSDTFCFDFYPYIFYFPLSYPRWFYFRITNGTLKTFYHIAFRNFGNPFSLFRNFRLSYFFDIL